MLDSSFLVAFHNENDVHHERARRGMDALLGGEWGPGLLPEYVFLEVTTVLAVRKDLATAVRGGEVLLRARELEHVACSDLFLDSFETFRSQSPAGLTPARLPGPNGSPGTTHRAWAIPRCCSRFPPDHERGSFFSDGQRFLSVEHTEAEPPVPPLEVVVNWTSLLQ